MGISLSEAVDATDLLNYHYTAAHKNHPLLPKEFAISQRVTMLRIHQGPRDKGES